MIIDSATFHFDVDRDETWPERYQRSHTSQVFRPDHLAFDVHATFERGSVVPQRIRVSGFRVLKNGTESMHRLGDSPYLYGLPEWVKRHVDEAVELVAGLIVDRHS
jgi:hypothetical protein